MHARAGGGARARAWGCAGPRRAAEAGVAGAGRGGCTAAVVSDVRVTGNELDAWGPSRCGSKGFGAVLGCVAAFSGPPSRTQSWTFGTFFLCVWGRRGQPNTAVDAGGFGASDPTPLWRHWLWSGICLDGVWEAMLAVGMLDLAGVPRYRCVGAYPWGVRGVMHAWARGPMRPLTQLRNLCRDVGGFHAGRGLE